MYRRNTEDLRPGMVVAQDVTDASGHVLLGSGVSLTPYYIEGLRRHGVPAILIQDGLADDVPPRDIISVALRSSVRTQLSTVFESAAVAGTDGHDRPRSAAQAVARLGNQPLRLDETADAAIERLHDSVERLLSEVLDDHSEAGLESLKSFSDYTYQHSVDVAAVAVLLGHRSGLGREDLRQLALGSLMHDIGKMYVEQAIIDKPGALTPEEREAIEEHPRLGFELVRRMPLRSILPAHVALQHHERQDGTGYPRNLSGSNRVIRSSAERLDGRRILLIAEVAAVADVYSALTSDRPYREALRHDVAADIIAKMSGAHLNAELVHRFLTTFPRYPIGHWVNFDAGTHRGCRGVVTDVSPRDVRRPRVQVLLDAAGGTVESPFEVDTVDDETIELSLIAVPREFAEV